MRRLVGSGMSFAALVLLAAACSSSAKTTSSSGEPTESAATAAVNSWFATTNKLSATLDASLVSKVATGPAATAYRSALQQVPKGLKSGPVYNLTAMTVDVPCQSSPSGAFVAFATTNVFTEGGTSYPAAMVFVRQGGTYKLYDFVQDEVDKTAQWPTLCTSGATFPNAAVATGGVPSSLAAALTKEATSPANDAAAVSPFALNDYTNISDDLKLPKEDTAAGETGTNVFSTLSYTTYSFPLAGEGGYWVFAPLEQVNTIDIPKGLTASTYPDGQQVGISPRPATLHRAVYEYETIYSVDDPAQSLGLPTVDGFAGYQLTAKAS